MPGPQTAGTQEGRAAGLQSQGKHSSQTTSQPATRLVSRNPTLSLKKRDPLLTTNCHRSGAQVDCLGSSLASSPSGWACCGSEHAVPSPLRKMPPHLTDVQTTAWSPGPHRDTGEGPGCNPGLPAVPDHTRPAPTAGHSAQRLSKQPHSRGTRAHSRASLKDAPPCAPENRHRGLQGRDPGSTRPCDAGRPPWALPQHCI